MPVTSFHQVSNPTALAAAALAAAAGLLHIAVTRTHLAESGLDGILMLVAAWIQLGFAVALLVAPTRLVRIAGAGALLLIVAGWAVARTAGLPFGHSEGAPEEVRLLGTVATVLGGLSGLVALVGVRPASHPTAPAARPPSPAVLAAVGTALVALVSVAIVVSPTGHSSGGSESDAHGHSSPGASSGPDHEGLPAGGTSGGPGAVGEETGGQTPPAAVTPSPAGGDGHEHAPGEAH